MGFKQFAARDRLRDLFAGFTGTGIWLLASLPPVLFLVRLFGLTLFSSPESDDFCLSSQNATNGFAETVWIWYNNAVGRVVPLVLIQIPAAISSATGTDYFTTYTVTLAGYEICFAVAIVLAAVRLWPKVTFAQSIFVGTALCATMLAGVPSLREMLYWLPGVTCYTLPGIVVILFLAEFVQTTETGTTITPVATGMLAIGGFVAALCNEFTPIWLIGIVTCSFAIRAIFWRDNLQLRQHAIVGGATLIGFAILLLAPGNVVRVELYPAPRDFGFSLAESYRFFDNDLTGFFANRWIKAWLVAATIFTLAQPRPATVAIWKRLLLAPLVAVLCIVSSYLPYFIAHYGTGSNLATRAQNETVMLLVFGLTTSVVLLARSFRDGVSRFAPAIFEWRSPLATSIATSIVAIVAGTILVSPLHNSGTAILLRSERSAFHVFWLESMERHALLTLSTEENIRVANRSVFPTALMAEDLTDNAYRLPNDCIARFYGKKTVLFRSEVQDATPASLLKLLSKLIANVRARNGYLGTGIVTPPMLDIRVASQLVRGQNFSTPWGRVVLMRSADTSAIDFYSLPRNVCRELLLGASQIDGVLRVGDSGSAADERPAPISPGESEKTCTIEGGIARVIFTNSAAAQSR